MDRGPTRRDGGQRTALAFVLSPTLSEARGGVPPTAPLRGSAMPEPVAAKAVAKASGATAEHKTLQHYLIRVLRGEE